ncbi:MAG: GNAT family N-acetyltransferase [Candidatus Puniceispirillaceae bacterium]
MTKGVGGRTERRRAVDLGQPVAGWTGAAVPARQPMVGHHCRLEPLRMDHAAGLHAAFRTDSDDVVWDWLPYGPFDDITGFEAFLEASCLGMDPMFHTIIDLASDRPVGMASYLRPDPVNGVIEVGHINFSPLMQRRPLATESMYLMMRRVFLEWGYRRYEWKCNNLNARSKAAAIRLGFSYEGLFRQAAVVKGHNRDTAWFSILDSEWPDVAAAFEAWLAPDNFDSGGRQRRGLADIRHQLCADMSGPSQS